VTTGDWLALAGDGLVVVTLVVTGLVFRADRRSARERDLDSTLAALEAAREGMVQWADVYFGKGYDLDVAAARAQQAFNLVMGGQCDQVFPVPTVPLTALLEQPGALGLIRKETIQAVSLALWRIGIFNQLVQQQTDFNTLHYVEIHNGGISNERRRLLAEASRAMSNGLHVWGIGGASWYQRLKAELDANVGYLRALSAERRTLRHHLAAIFRRAPRVRPPGGGRGALDLVTEEPDPEYGETPD
jgi:hypothetical protein